jgi:aldose 1-epimerase
MIEQHIDRETGWSTIHVRRNNLQLMIVPAAGANVCSLSYAGQQLLHQAPSLPKLLGFHYGIPLLYPTPGRVPGGLVQWEGTRCQFRDRAGLGAIHGVACQVPWDLVGFHESSAAATILCEHRFDEDSAAFAEFPFPHQLQLTLQVTDQSVRWELAVDNRYGDHSIPFGWGLHPWFRREREADPVRITVPVAHHCELHEGIATGKYLSASPQSNALLSGMTLDYESLDDVFVVNETTPAAVIDNLATETRICLSADMGTRFVVIYAPAGQPWYCVENWSSAPGALAAAVHGSAEQSGLCVVSPGNLVRRWIEMNFSQGSK